MIMKELLLYKDIVQLQKEMILHKSLRALAQAMKMCTGVALME